MKLVLKLYAGLSDYLPDFARENKAEIDIDEVDAVCDVITRFNIPGELVHLVLLNGVYLHPEERASTRFKEGDTLAIWPPVAGG